MLSAHVHVSHPLSTLFSGCIGLIVELLQNHLVPYECTTAHGYCSKNRKLQHRQRKIDMLLDIYTIGFRLSKRTPNDYTLRSAKCTYLYF